MSVNLSYVNTKLKQQLNNNTNIESSSNKTSSNKIGAKVYNILTEYNSIVFASLVVLLIVLIIILYRYTFQKGNDAILKEVIYHKKIDLEPLPPCSQIDESYQFRLCDYYIASSFNTFSIGQQHFDYVSNDMLKRVLQSGARYIQFPICSNTMAYNAEPVIGTAEKGKNAITSLNTQSVREALIIIRDYAFKKVKNTNTSPLNNSDDINSDILNYDMINYPLIIHLQIHTYSVDVLNQFYNSMVELLGDYLLSNDKYNNYPIGLEKLCSLLNRIIIISTPGYENSLLDNLVIPTNHLFQTKLKQDFLAKELLIDNQTAYYRSLSLANQKKHKKDIENIEQKIRLLLSPDMQKQKQKQNTSGSTSGNIITKDIITKDIIPDVNEREALTLFNMIGLTLVEPMETNEIYSTNYNPLDPITFGCQLVAMNYHIVDEHMNTMIDIFKANSFILKPSGLRLPILSDEMQDFLDQFTVVKTKPINYIPDYLYKHNNQYITLQETTSLRNKYISFLGNGFKVSQISDKNITVDNLFMVKKSPLSDANNFSIMLVHPNNPYNVLTVVQNFKESEYNIKLSVMANDLKLLQYQSFYPEVGMTQTDDDTLNGVTKVSFRLALDNDSNNKDNKLFYLGVVNNQIQLLSEGENKDNISIQYKKIDVDSKSIIKNPIFGTLAIFDSENGVLGMTKNINKNSMYAFNIKAYNGNLLGNKKNTGLFSQIVTIQEIKKGGKSGKYLCSNLGNLSMLDDVIHKNCIFTIAKENNEDDQIVINDFEEKYLIANDDGTLKFVYDKTRSSKINTNQKRYLINRMLGLEKFFIIKKDIVI